MVHIHSVAHHKFKKNGVDLQVYIIKGNAMTLYNFLTLFEPDNAAWSYRCKLNIDKNGALTL